MSAAVLIAAQSGRALAAAARRAGYRPYVADLFGDEDTLALAEGWRRLPGRFGAGRRGMAALEVIDALAADAGGDPLGLVLGSGFEDAPDLVARLARRHRMLGTGAEAVALVKDPLRLAALLADLGIPHPPVTLDAVPDPAAWLSKRRGGSGGGHVRPARPGPPGRGRYHQRRVAGRPVGLAILGDGRDAQLIGATEQFAAPAPGKPYRFAGALEPAALPEPMRREMEAAVRAVARRAGLVGLSSADCLVDGNRWWLLEINPRPGGSLDALDRRPTPLFVRHVEACLGRLGEAEPAPVGAAATRILYADGDIPAVPPVAWPDGVLDRPCAGSRIGRGSPVCTLLARGLTAADASRRLDRLEAELRAILPGEGDHGYGLDGAGAPERERARGGPRRPARP